MSTATLGIMTVTNLWHNAQSAYSHPLYALTSDPVFEHRGVQAYRVPAGGFLYVLGDAAIMHRVALDRTGKVIDDILDGESCCSDKVAAHIRAHGFAAMTFGEYSDAVAVGRLS